MACACLEANLTSMRSWLVCATYRVGHKRHSLHKSKVPTFIWKVRKFRIKRYAKLRYGISAAYDDFENFEILRVFLRNVMHEMSILRLYSRLHATIVTFKLKTFATCLFYASWVYNLSKYQSYQNRYRRPIFNILA